MNHVYGISEIVGTSTESLDAAIRNGISRAAATVRDLDWFEVTEIRGHLEEGNIGHFQVGLKIGFRLEDPPRRRPEQSSIPEPSGDRFPAWAG